MVLDISLFYS